MKTLIVARSVVNSELSVLKCCAHSANEPQISCKPPEAVRWVVLKRNSTLKVYRCYSMCFSCSPTSSIYIYTTKLVLH
jgi:hypothetical protein